MSAQCIERHPTAGLRCQLSGTHDRHYCVDYSDEGRFMVWPEEEIPEFPEAPRNVRCVTNDGTEYPVDLVYLGKFDGFDTWEIAQPFTRKDRKLVRVESMPDFSRIVMNFGDVQ